MYLIFVFEIYEKWLFTERDFFIAICDHRLNMELDLQSLFGLLCLAVLIG
jgi:hypothetical protein